MLLSDGKLEWSLRWSLMHLGALELKSKKKETRMIFDRLQRKRYDETNESKRE